MSSSKVYIIKYSVDGVELSFYIVGTSVRESIEVGNKLCAGKVGDSWKQKAIAGEYLKNIEVIKIDAHSD